MAPREIRDTEKIAVGAIGTALQTWRAPELMNIGDRLTHVQARLDTTDHRVSGREPRAADFRAQLASLQVQFARQG